MAKQVLAYSEKSFLKSIRITALFVTLFSFFLYKTGSLLLKKPGHNAPLIKYLCQNRKSHSLKSVSGSYVLLVLEEQMLCR